MKRTILRSSMFVVVVLAVAIGVSAQTSQQYRADIPFDFEAGGRQHSAGKYRIGSVSMIGSGPIGLLDVQSGKMQVLRINALPGNDGYWDNRRGTVTFLKVDEKYVLTEISTPSFKLKLKDKRTKMRDERLASAGTVVKINLN